MSLLRAWLIGTAVLLGCTMVWAFVPILVPLILVFCALGGLVTLIVALVRFYERRRGRNRVSDDSLEPE
jgi:hypothetical protein